MNANATMIVQIEKYHLGLLLITVIACTCRVLKIPEIIMNATKTDPHLVRTLDAAATGGTLKKKLKNLPGKLYL